MLACTNSFAKGVEIEEDLADKFRRRVAAKGLESKVGVARIAVASFRISYSVDYIAASNDQCGFREGVFVAPSLLVETELPEKYAAVLRNYSG